jgi:hypothetical protein
MSRKYTDLYPLIYQPGNLWQAFKQAARGKRFQPAVAVFEYDLETNLLALEKELASCAYQPGAYHNFVITSPKRRLISAAPFRDRVVHHALMNVIEPLFERQFIYDSYANRVGKGTHSALDRCTYFLRRNRYVMHLDVRQFFPSIDHAILLGILNRTVADPKIIGLIEKILASGAGIQSAEYTQVFFPGDDLFAALRPRGLPIGNLTSQHWANVYLNDLDQYAKRKLNIRAYIRYVDDILIFSDHKSDLSDWKRQMIAHLKELRLTLHENQAQSRPVETGVSFLGFKVFPDHRLLKRCNGVNYQRRLKIIAQSCREKTPGIPALQASLQGWLNHASYGDTWGLRQAVLHKAGLDYKVGP